MVSECSLRYFLSFCICLIFSIVRSVLKMLKESVSSSRAHNNRYSVKKKKIQKASLESDFWAKISITRVNQEQGILAWEQRSYKLEGGNTLCQFSVWRCQITSGPAGKGHSLNFFPKCNERPLENFRQWQDLISFICKTEVILTTSQTFCDNILNKLRNI